MADKKEAAPMMKLMGKMLAARLPKLARPGKRNKMSLTLEQVSVETELAKIARLYNLTEEEVAQRLNVKPTGTDIPV